MCSVSPSILWPFHLSPSCPLLLIQFNSCTPPSLSSNHLRFSPFQLKIVILVSFGDSHICFLKCNISVSSSSSSLFGLFNLDLFKNQIHLTRFFFIALHIAAGLCQHSVEVLGLDVTQLRKKRKSCVCSSSYVTNSMECPQTCPMEIHAFIAQMQIC